MNWLSALKLLPVLTTLGLAVVALIQTEKLSSTRSELSTVKADRDAKDRSISQHQTALDTRDSVIRLQTSAIDKLRATANANRDAYRAALSTARDVSAQHSAAADELLALKGPEGELEQCRAARNLLEQELVR